MQLFRHFLLMSLKDTSETPQTSRTSSFVPETRIAESNLRIDFSTSVALSRHDMEAPNSDVTTLARVIYVPRIAYDPTL